MESGSINLVAFDAVGTLIYPEPDVGSAYASVARRFGSKLDEAEIASRFGQVFGEEEVLDRDADGRTSEAMERDRWRRIVTRVLFDVDRPDDVFSQLFEH